MENPGRYGFKESLKVCCGSGDPPYNFNRFVTCGSRPTSPCPNPSRYINWDGVHLTEAMYNVLTNMFVSGTFSHPPFGSLLDRKPRRE
uniref:GDSL-motif lipase/hydrolase family protein n=1 Tax=Rhizophora mucronata TaxID=61149 RepID=A0A2P2N9W2_RHIMU